MLERGHMNVGQVAGTVVLLCAAAAPAWSQPAPVRATLGGRMHYQWNSTSIDQAEAGAAAPVASSTFETRRVRLAVDVQVSDWIRGMIEPEFAMGRLALRNAWVAFEVDSALVVRAGQFKKPFGLVLLTSSARLPVIERGVRIRGLDDALRRTADGRLGEVRGQLLVGEHFALLETQLYLAYEMGLAVEGRRGPLGWSLGVFNGGGPDQRDENDGYSAAGRVTWRAEGVMPVVLGAAWSRRELNWPTPVSPETRSGDAFAVDAELGTFRRGMWVVAELATGDNLGTLERFVGAQAIASYFVATGGARIEGWEPVGRVSWGDPDRGVAGDEGLLLTPGMNLYFAGRNRLMLNWDVYMPRGDGFDTQHAARAQVNLHF
jgi:hypothetical protein